jgi:hypothetical protein
MEHSKLPWELRQHGQSSYSVMSGDMVLTVLKRYDMPEINKANAAFIVKACNSHATLQAKAELFNEAVRLLKKAGIYIDSRYKGKEPDLYPYEVTQPINLFLSKAKELDK